MKQENSMNQPFKLTIKMATQLVAASNVQFLILI